MIEEKFEKVICQNCDAEIPQGAIFCPVCGKRPEDKHDAGMPQVPQPTTPAEASHTNGVCSNCGEAIIPDTLYCWRCGRPAGGKNLLGNPAVEVQSTATRPVSQPVRLPVTQPADLPKVKSTWRYPFLKILQFLMRLTGILISLAGLVFIVATLVGSAVITRRLLDQYNLGTSAISAGGEILVVLVTIILLFMLVAPIFAAAEFIQMFMDIENNQRVQLALLQHERVR